MQRRSYAFIARKTPRTTLFVMVVALLTALTSTSLFAQTTEAPPLDIESYTTPIDVQNVDQVERLLVKQFADYQWVDEFAMDATGRVVAVSGRNSDSGDYSIISVNTVSPLGISHILRSVWSPC